MKLKNLQTFCPHSQNAIDVFLCDVIAIVILAVMD